MHICGTTDDRRNYTIPKGLLGAIAWRTSVRTHVTEFGGVGEVVGGVVLSLTQLDLVELVVSSLTD